MKFTMLNSMGRLQPKYGAITELSVRFRILCDYDPGLSTFYAY